MIRREQVGRVRRITLAAPQQKNILTAELSRSFLAELADAERDPETGSVLVDAEGQVFCAGLDFDNPPAHEIFEFGHGFAKPVVVSMRGVAMSAGVALLANAHIVVAAQGCSFGLTDLREGRFHEGVFRSAVQVFGERRARELALTARIFTTPDALAWGLVHAAVPTFELDDRVLAVAQGLASAKPEAVQAILKR